MRRSAVALVAGGVALGVVAEWSAYLPDSPDLAAGDFVVGLAFIGGGALALRRSTATGALMAATGFAWFLGGLAGGLVFLHRGPLVHLLLAYPRGRLDSRFDRVVVAAAYADGARVRTRTIQSGDARSPCRGACRRPGAPRDGRRARAPSAGRRACRDGGDRRGAYDRRGHPPHRRGSGRRAALGVRGRSGAGGGRAVRRPALGPLDAGRRYGPGGRSRRPGERGHPPRPAGPLSGRSFARARLLAPRSRRGTSTRQARRSRSRRRRATGPSFSSAARRISRRRSSCTTRQYSTSRR